MNLAFDFFLKKLITLSNQKTLVPFYHKISDKRQTFEKYLYTPRKIVDFKEDISIFSKYYNPICMLDLIDNISSKQKCNENYFHITFDDGLSNFYHVVAPILLEKKIPATVFVNSDFIDNKALFYRYKVSLLYQEYEKSTSLEKRKFHNFFSNNQSVKENLFSINFNNKELLDKLASEINFSFEELLEIEKPYLTKSQIQELIDMGFTIGAHSKSHPLYSDISLGDQLLQTKENIDWLFKEFKITDKVFSFPFTDLDVKTDFFNQQNLDISFGTSGIKKDDIKNNFQRIFFEIGNAKAESYLLKEYIKYFFKILLGKNKMPRE